MMWRKGLIPVDTQRIIIVHYPLEKIKKKDRPDEG